MTAYRLSVGELRAFLGDSHDHWPVCLIGTGWAIAIEVDLDANVVNLLGSDRIAGIADDDPEQTP